MKTYIINGDPVALARPRFSSAAIKAYDPQKNLKLMAGISMASQHEGPLYTKPLELSIIFFMKASKRRLGYHATRPDLDNLIKFILDVGNSVLFQDDSQIASIIAKKIYDKNPRTEFTLREL